MTDGKLVEEMLNQLPADIWFDASKTWADFCCGTGEFIVRIARRLNAAGHSWQHIIENMIYFNDINPNMVEVTKFRLALYGDYKYNYFCDDFIATEETFVGRGKNKLVTVRDFCYRNNIVGKKFDVIVGNPPYKQGLFRKFLINSFEMSKQYIMMVCPDSIDPSSRRNAEMIDIFKANGVQIQNSASHYFPGLTTSGEIKYYIFNKLEAFNINIFNMSDKALFEENIIEKINKLINEKGSLNPKTTTTYFERKNNKTIDTIISVTKDGIVIEKRPISEVRLLNNAQNYFFIHKFFGINKNDPVYEYCGKIGLGDNLYIIEKPSGMDVTTFKEIYTSNIIRFILKYFRGTNTRTLRWSLEKLPILNSLNEVKQVLTNEELEYIEKAMS